MQADQLADAIRHADAGTQQSGGDALKKPSDDHAVSVRDSMVDDAREKMSSAVERLQESFRTRQQTCEIRGINSHL